MKPIVCVISFALGASGSALQSAEVPAKPADEQRVPSSQNQSNAPADLETTRAIRQALVGDTALSAGAKNVQVITIAGKVTLRGKVKTEEEKARILETARHRAGAKNVDDRLELKPKP